MAPGHVLSWSAVTLLVCLAAGVLGTWHLAPGHLVTWSPGTWLVCLALVHLAPGWCAWHLCTWHLAGVPGTCAPGTWLVCLAPGHLGTWHLAGVPGPWQLAG